jgi:glycosyltransferase involved in cell wall biosynthesis
MRILMGASVRDSTSTGVPRQNRALASELERAGHEVEFLFLPERTGWPASANSVWYSLRMAPRLVAWSARRRFDVYVLHAGDGWLYGMLRRLLPALLPTPYVMASHGLEHRFWEVFLAEERAGRLPISTKHRVFTRWVRLTAVELAVRTCDRLICLTRSERDYIVGRRWKRPAAIAVVANGVGPEYFAGEALLRAPLRNLVYIGPWSWNKGRRLIAAAFAALAPDRPALALTLVGPSSQDEVLADFPAELRARVRVLPSLSPSEVAEELPRHDIFVFPSLFEGGPLTLLEAMAAGLAVVTSDCYAMAEVVTNGKDGLLVSPGDAEAFTAAIGRLLDHPEQARRLGTGGRRRARALSWQAAGAGTLQVLESTVGPGRLREPVEAGR